MPCSGCKETTLWDGTGCVHRKQCRTTFDAVRVVIGTEYDQRIAKAGGVPGAVGYDSLTRTERRVLLLLGSGVSLLTAAMKLNMTEKSVGFTRYRICQKLNLELGAGRDVIRDYVQARNLFDLEETKAYVKKNTAVL